jgi:hypothetical protein
LTTLDSQLLMNRIGGVVAMVMVFLLGASIFALVKIDVPKDNQNALLVLIGALTTNVTAIVAFFFGSSSTNKSKDNTINTLSNTAATVAGTARVAQVALTPNAAADKVVSPGPGETGTARWQEPTV